MVLVGTREDNHSAYSTHLFQCGLHLAERDVFASRQLDQVLLAVNDAERSGLVHDPNVASVEPNFSVLVRGEILETLLLHLKVAGLAHSVASDEDLPSWWIVSDLVAHLIY